MTTKELNQETMFEMLYAKEQIENALSKLYRAEEDVITFEAFGKDFIITITDEAVITTTTASVSWVLTNNLNDQARALNELLINSK